MHAVDAGVVSVSAAADVATLPIEPRRVRAMAEIRLRARRRIGELSAGLETAPSGRAAVSLPSTGKSKSEALSAAGISKSEAHGAAVERAIASQVAEQFEFVAWWGKHVRGPGKSNSRRPGVIDAEAAEAATGISNQQVSKWRKRQKDAEGYIAQIGAGAR